MSLPNLLQYLLKENVDEVAKSIGDAQSAKLALYREEGTAILFDPQAFYNEMDSLFGDKALEKSFANFQTEMERLKAMITEPGLLKMWTDNFDKLNQKMQSFLSSPNKWEAREINEMLGVVGNVHYKLFQTRAAQLKNKPAERLKLNREKEAFERLSNKVVEGVFLASDPTYEDRVGKDLISSALVNSIRGYTDFVFSDSCNGPITPKTYEVRFSAANKGWGPLIYDITMSLVNPGYLIADRNANSTDADKIWTYYLKSRPDVHKELMEELIMGKDCGLPTSSNKELNRKLNRAQKIIDQKNSGDSRSNSHTREDLEELIEQLQASLSDMEKNPEASQRLKDITIERLENYQAMLDELPEQSDIKDEDRLEDVMEEMKKILADVPQAWRFQIQTPINISALDNRYKLFMGRVLSVYGKHISKEDFRRAGRMFFDINYSPGD